MLCCLLWLKVCSYSSAEWPLLHLENFVDVVSQWLFCLSPSSGEEANDNVNNVQVFSNSIRSTKLVNDFLPSFILQFLL